MDYLLYISLFLFIVFFLQFVLFRFMPLYRLNLLTTLYDYARWIKTNPKVLIMGSSHARGQISPEELAKLTKKYSYEEIYNVGADAACPFSMYITYEKSRHKFKDLDLVYFTLDPHMLSEKYYLYTKFEKVFLSFKQWRYFTKHHKNYLKKHHQENNKYFFPSIIFYKSLEFNRPIFSGRNNGFSPLPHFQFNTYKENTVAKYIYDPLEVFPVSTFQIEHLSKLKKAVEQNGAKFILVLTPSHTWAKFYEKEAQEYDTALIDALNHYLGDSSVIGSKFGEDYGLQYEDFKDDTHLAETGALKFTNIIFKDIDNHHKLSINPIKHTYDYRLKSSNE